VVGIVSSLVTTSIGVFAGVILQQDPHRIERVDNKQRGLITSRDCRVIVVKELDKCYDARMVRVAGPLNRKKNL
jgi:hypothetical protein